MEDANVLQEECGEPKQEHAHQIVEIMRYGPLLLMNADAYQDMRESIKYAQSVLKE